MTSLIDRLWYQPRSWWLLAPLAWIFQVAAYLRRQYYQSYAQKKSNTPLIVIGNLSVGGVGKTPLVIAIANKLTEQGLKVGVVSRGYGGSLTNGPYEISRADSPKQVGDEPLLIAQKTNCPVVIASKRVKAVEYLERQHACDVILSDDGLQHYAMGRDIEIAVIDGTRGLGNGYCLPLGPLRESESRLSTVDLIVVNEGDWPDAHGMSMKPGNPFQINSGKEHCLADCPQPIAAVAGIGNPQRFFSLLEHLKLNFTAYPFPDHHHFQPKDLHFEEPSIIMTEKDAVKCHSFATDKMYALPVEAQLSDDFWQALFSNPHLNRQIER